MPSRSMEQSVPFRQSAVVTVDGTVFTILYRDPCPKDVHRTGQVMHVHGILELHLITSGGGRLLTETESLCLREGDCVLVGKNTLHLLQASQGEPFERFELQIAYERQPDSSGFLRYLDELRVCRWHDCDALMDLSAAIGRELLQKEPVWRERLRAYFMLLLTELIRYARIDIYAMQTPLGPENSASLFAADLMAIDAILTSDSRITAEGLASRLFISRRQLYRVLNRYQGATFKQKLMVFRMEAARRLLEDSDMPLSEVAQRVGYESAASFCKAFKKKTGVSPGTYRKALL